MNNARSRSFCVLKMGLETKEPVHLENPWRFCLFFVFCNIATHICVSFLSQKNTSLKSLNLRGNNIRDDGATSLAVGLADNHTLVKLHLGLNDVAEEGAASFQQLLEVK